MARGGSSNYIRVHAASVWQCGKSGSCNLLYKFTAELYKSKFPSAAETVLRASIVDDMLDSRPTLGEAQSLAKELVELFPFCGMSIAKFFSNNFDVLKEVPEAKRLPVMESMEFLKEDNTIKVSVKALGIKWNAVSDSFFFSVKEPTEAMTAQWTKLHFVSFSHQIYDLSLIHI